MGNSVLHQAIDLWPEDKEKTRCLEQLIEELILFPDNGLKLIEFYTFLEELRFGEICSDTLRLLIRRIQSQERAELVKAGIHLLKFAIAQAVCEQKQRGDI